MIQVDRNHQTACAAAVPWPCNNDVVASYPLQVINQINLQDENDTDDLACNNGRGTAQIKRLNLEDGVYTDLCNIPGRCLNACGIHPQTNLLYCNERPGNDNLVRVDCDVNVAELEARTVAGTVGAYVAVTGSLCFLGRLQDTFSSNLDVDGNFWFMIRDASYDPRGGALYRITNATLGTLIGSTVPVTSGPRIDGARDNQVVVGRSNLRLIFDLIVVFLDFGPTLGVGEQEYVVGCWSNLVYVQQVSGDLTNADLITLEMVGANPGQSSPRGAGAQWLSNGSIYCAYNDGSSGVIQVLLTQTNLVSTTSGTVPAGRVGNSEATNSNDGMNCLLAASPFPPVTTSTTTTTTTTSGGGRGDPHIYTLGGEHYLLLGQGSFSFWRFSGVDAEALSGNMWKKAPVDFQIYAHYSTHSSWTKGLLLVDQSGHQGYGSRALELTSEDCRWRSEVPGGTSWHMVDEAKLISDGDEMTAFKLVRSQSQRMHVELLMKTQTGWKNIGKLYATCKPGYHINMKMTMFSKEDVNRVQGQLGVVHHSEYRRGGGAGLLETDQGHQRTDQEFLLHKDWVALGGSTGASVYLKETDEDGPAVLKGCSESERAIAGELCVKFLGSEETVPNFQESMEDCVFDVCAGGGEAAAELAADIMKAF